MPPISKLGFYPDGKGIGNRRLLRYDVPMKPLARSVMGKSSIALFSTLLVGSRMVMPLAAEESAAPKPSQPPLPLVPGAEVVALWPTGSPTLKGFDEKEVFTRAKNQPTRVQSVANVHNPSIELHLAPVDKANGTAIIVAPGGGNKNLGVGTEGVDIAAWLNHLGTSAFILRYRLQPYSSSVDALADTQRSIRLIRAHAKEWGIDPNKIGIMGFSAGGEQAARAALHFDGGNAAAVDPVEQQSDRPDFAVLIYAGWRELDLSQVPTNAPSVFLTSAGVDDAFHARQTVDFYNAFFNAKIPVELHVYGHGGHAGGLSPSNGIPFGTWQDRFVDWITDLKLMKQP